MQLTNVTKSFGPTIAVDDVSLSVAPGEILGLIGENGAGKTTLMRIIAGEIEPDRGTIDVGGTIGFVHQHFMLVNEFTIAENLALVGAGDARFENSNRLVRDLSVGEKAAVELMKAIAKEPDLLILDEPTSVLTPNEAQKLFDTARELASRGKSVILISHKIREVLSIAIARAMVGERTHVAPPLRRRTTPAESRLYVRNLSVGTGEIVAVIGVAGNGQAELATMLRDTLPRETTAHIPEDRTRDGVIAEMSIAENLALVTNASAEELIATFGIRATGPRQRAGNLSGGNQQKLVLGRELTRSPAIIIAAEPTRGLDIESTAFVHEQLRAAAARGAAILLITSDLDEAFTLADGIHVIFRGTLSERLTPAEAGTRAGQLMAGVR
ncbi:MAG: hypothetical protein DMF58_07610 [Acidobacteria bacterium]|nr:MAG: hypothetical protein DMF58_07610 [Acidobacteriota bacterium]